MLWSNIMQNVRSFTCDDCWFLFFFTYIYPHRKKRFDLADLHKFRMRNDKKKKKNNQVFFFKKERITDYAEIIEFFKINIRSPE